MMDVSQSQRRLKRALLALGTLTPLPHRERGVFFFDVGFFIVLSCYLFKKSGHLVKGALLVLCFLKRLIQGDGRIGVEHGL